MLHYHLFLIGLVCILFTKWLWSRRHLYILSTKIQGPFSVPFIGSVVPCLKFLTQNPLDVLWQEYEKYSGLIRAWLGPYLYLIVIDPEDVESVLCHSVVAKPPILADAWGEGMGDGLLTMSNDDEFSVWKAHKRIISHSLTLATIKIYYKSMRSVGEILQKDMENLCNKGLIDIAIVVRRFSADAVTKSMYDVSLDFRLGTRDQIFESTETMLKCIYDKIVKFWYQFEPIYRFSALKKTLFKTRNDTKELAEEIYKTKMNDYITKPPGHDQESILINVLLKSQLNGLMTKDEVIEEIMNLWSAASDTVGNALEFLLLMLAMHKDCQNKAFDEINSFFKHNTTVEWSDLDKFPYLDMCMKESIRLFPPGPITLRYSTKEFILKSKNIKIPPGTNMAVVGFLTMRHPKIWKNPNTFDPERFNPESSAERHPCAYYVFSKGPRKCPGYSFAKVSMKLCLIYVLRKYELHSDWKLKDLPLGFDLNVRSLWGYLANVTHRKVMD